MRGTCESNASTLIRKFIMTETADQKILELVIDDTKNS